jgi:acyl CoA:acetate/3-ketoacid CoA transferase beta subunit
MWSRAKREGRGEKVDERVWASMARGTEIDLVTDEGVADVDEDEMAYASDSDKVKTR